MFNDITNIVFIVLVLLCGFAVIRKLVWSQIAPVKTVRAEVVDKYKTSVFSTKYHGTFRQERCMVVFAVNGRKLSFAVSEFSYNSYKRKEKGTLKYKGNQIISFK